MAPPVPGTSARWLAVLIASTCFALVHPWWTQAPIFLLAIVLGYVYERTGNLWAPILIHMGFNCTSLVISYFGG